MITSFDDFLVQRNTIQREADKKISKLHKELEELQEKCLHSEKSIQPLENPYYLCHHCNKIIPCEPGTKLSFGQILEIIKST